MRTKELAHWRYMVERLEGVDLSDNVAAVRPVLEVLGLSFDVELDEVDKLRHLGLWLLEEARYHVMLAKVEGVLR